jgi:hypothetical protein
MLTDGGLLIAEAGRESGKSKGKALVKAKEGDMSSVSRPQE